MRIGNRRLWFKVHGWASLPVWILFCFVCLTGTLSVVSHELTWLTNPAARAANPDGLPARPLPELLAAVERAVPGAEIGQVTVHEPYLVHVVNLSTAEQPGAIAYVNQYTGEVQAVFQGLTFIGFMRSLHGWLLFPWQDGYSVGYYLVSAMSLVVLTAMITGMVVYKRFWRAYTRPLLRTRDGARALLGDLHRLAGAWSLWFLLVMGLTGLWYLTQAVLWHNHVDVWDEPKPIAIDALPISDGAPPARISFEQALGAARQALPSIEPHYVTLPEHNRDYYSIAGRGDAFLLFDQYSFRAFVNPWTGEVAEQREPATMNLLQTLTHIADPLHYGTFAGLWTKVIWFVFGAILTGMSITGFLMWGRRTVQGARKPARARAAALPPADAIVAR